MENMVDAVLKSMNCIGVLITDGEGNILQVDSNFDEYYGVPARDILYKNIHDLEREGFFRPSTVAMVLRSGKEVTAIQKVRNGQEVIVTAIPLVDEKKKITRVVTFSRDVSEYTRFKQLYDALNKKIDQYNRSLDELSYEQAVIEDFHTNNGKFQQILMSIQRVAKYDINILLQGETGVGKTLIAKKIHNLSAYSGGRFVEINCGAMPESLIESELFGYEKGAFTGASSFGKKGLFEIANGGTLFLDEISEMSLSSQVKLLKVLQDQTFRPIGGTDDIKVNCRLICASNKDLLAEAEAGRFRQDLFYRLNTVSFTIPPLRERKEDIISLSNSMLAKASEKYGFQKIFDSAVLSLFVRYPWPGNIRELENTVNLMAITSEGDVITKEYLPKSILESTGSGVFSASAHAFSDIRNLTEAMEQYEGEIVRSVYERAPSSIQLAKVLNISQTTASRKIRKYIKS